MAKSTDQTAAQGALTTIMEAAGEDLAAFMKYEAPTPLPELQKARLLRAVKQLVETAPPEMGFPGRGGKLLYWLSAGQRTRCLSSQTP